MMHFGWRLMMARPAEFAENVEREPMIRPSPNSPLFRVAKTRQSLHIIDLRMMGHMSMAICQPVPSLNSPGRARYSWCQCSRTMN